MRLLADKVSKYVHSEKRVPSVLIGYHLTLLPDKVIWLRASVPIISILLYVYRP